MSGGGSGPDAGARVACDPQGNIYLTGIVQQSRGTFDGWPLPAASSGIPTIFAARLNSAPALKTERTSAGVVLAWPAKATNYIPEMTTDLAQGFWQPVDTSQASVIGTTRSNPLPGRSAVSSQFFRLRRK
jgi:hypothetical protein